jgi:hypothetical protein
VKQLRVLVVFALLTTVVVAPALAVVEQVPPPHLPAVWSATYVAAFQPTLGNQGVPYSGVLKLNFKDGIITGTYQSESVRPDPMYGRIINVTGNINKGYVSLRFSSFTLPNGTIDHNGTIGGTANWQGKLWDFLAIVKSRP